MGEADDRDDGQPGSAEEAAPAAWPAGAVARRLGIAPTTLRSWHHRYGLGPQASSGAHRRYTEQDVVVLETMARLVAQGVAPSAAAEIANSRRDAPSPPSTGRGDLRERIAAQAARGLVLAAQRLDGETLRHVLEEEFTHHDLEQVWEQLCVPALTALGRRVTPDGHSIDAVLLLSWTITAALHHTSGGLRSNTTRARRALLACPEGERHSLGLEVLQAALTAQRVPTTMLGASVPASVLTGAADRIRPAAVVVWSQMPHTARPGLLRRLTPLATTTIAAGPGWAGTRLPAGVVHVTGLGDAIGSVVKATTLDLLPADPQDPTS